MPIIIIAILLWIGIKAIDKRHKPPDKPKQKQPKTTAQLIPATYTTCARTPNNALAYLNEQKRTLIQIVEDIDSQLEYAPPNRQTLMQRRAMTLNRIATVENKIQRIART